MEKQYVLGLDYGTDSVRAMIADTATGEEIASEVSYYPRWGKGLYCNPAQNKFRQHPLDYIESLEAAVKGAIKKSPSGTGKSIRALSVDTTGSTPAPVNKEGTPLALLPEFQENPNAMFDLWKDHTAVKEAEEINHLARTWGGTDYTKYEGGVYSAEWFWAKILHVNREAPEIQEAAWSWVEHCDWIPALLSGINDVSQVKRSRCAAGHKAMWHPDWNGLPPKEFLEKLAPELAELRDRLYTDTHTSDEKSGELTAEWAERLGLEAGIPIGVGAFDAHLGAVGGEIKPYYLSKVMGTSTCDMMVAPEEEVGDKLIKGISGQVDGSVIPGMMGLEAGQSAFGDVYAWFKNILMWPVNHILLQNDSKERQQIAREMEDQMIAQLSKAAEKIDPAESGVLALDWLNGRRTPDANQKLTGAIAGLTLGTDAPSIFRALVEATAFGSKKIVDRFRSEGVRIDGVIALGGVAKKSDMVMQIVSDVLDMPIEVAHNEQTVALGSAMAASVVAGIHSDFGSAQKAMGRGMEKSYHPRPEFVEKYKKLYEKYEAFGEFIEKDFIKK